MQDLDKYLHEPDGEARLNALIAEKVACVATHSRLMGDA